MGQKFETILDYWLFFNILSLNLLNFKETSDLGTIFQAQLLLEILVSIPNFYKTHVQSKNHKYLLNMFLYFNII